MLHEGATSGIDAIGFQHSKKIYKRIIPRKDTCVNRENPNRKLPSSRALVCGFDPRGVFGGVINHGFTHGYWTLNTAPFATPEDGAGNQKGRPMSSNPGGDYVARILLEFDLDDAGITAGDKIEDARLVLTYYRSKSIQGGKEFTFDFHRFHPGLTGNTGDINGRSDNKFTENATWWEYNFSNGVTYDAARHWGQIQGIGATGSFAVSSGATHGANRWEFQGLGATGSTAEHLNTFTTGAGLQYHGVTGWKDFSGGPAGSDQDAYADSIYIPGFVAKSTNVKAGKTLTIDLRNAVTDALSYYNNKVRIMIKLRNDEAFDGTSDRAYLTFFSSESESGLPQVSAIRSAKYSPALHITYLR